MTESQIEAEIQKIRSTSQSQADLLLQGIGLLAKVLKPEQGDPYMTDIRMFHEKFGLGYAEGPRHLTPVLSEFRQRFMQEELDEYIDAVRQGNLEKQFDALIDLVYVALGTAYLQGMPFMRGWQRVQMANMAKVRTPKPTARGAGFDIVKPEGWKPPQLSDLINPIQ